FITITVQEPDQDKAESTLLRMGNEATATLRSLDDCHATVLDRTERLRVMSNIVRPRQPFFFDEETFVPQKRLRTHDFIAPWSITSTTKSGP
ncbi:transfer complex protein, partial [Burkholderia multivorans]